MLFYTILFATALLDQLAKVWVRLTLQIGEEKAFWEPFVSFLHFENTGAAGSSFQGYGRYFIIVGVLFVAGAVFLYRKRQLSSVWLQSGAAFLAGGAVGNTVDRVLFGKVTDFLVFGSHGGVLNLADLFLNVGVLLIVFDVVLSYWRDKRGSADASLPSDSEGA